MALIDKLNAIGEAIRARTGKSEKLTLEEMPLEIGGITEDLDSVLTEQEALIDELKEVLQGKASGGAGDTMVGTWIFNSEITPFSNQDFSVNFSSRGSDYRVIEIYTGGVGTLHYSTHPNDWTDQVYRYNTHTWVYEEYRTITITEEPTDAECIAWIKANARKATYEDGFAEGEKAILSTYVDWSVSAASNSCVVDFYNECDYYAHIYLFVERLSGDYYDENFVLRPHEEVTISNGDIGWSGLSGEEWTVQVTIEGFSKDGEL